MEVFFECGGIYAGWIESSLGRVERERPEVLEKFGLLDIGGLDRVDGLQDLNKLAYFHWVSSFGCDGEEAVSRRMMEQLPASLKVIQVAASRDISFTPDLFARCTNLTMLEVGHNRDKNLDLRDCASLQTVIIYRSNEVENLYFSTDCSSLQTVKLAGLLRLKCVTGLSPEATSNLQSLEVICCLELVEIPQS